MQSFKIRQKARRYAMQALYGWLISGSELKDIEAFYRADRNPKNFDLAYFQNLLYEIPAKLEEIDQTINRFLDRPLKDVDPIELTILRIATYEFLFSFDVPYRVIIHEAVELAKTFGAIDSYKFSNSILHNMAHELRINEIELKEQA